MTTASTNFTTLYSGAGTINPTQAYGNANVVSLLAVGTDGGNTVANITATGNVTAAYFIGNGSLLTNINAGNISGNVNFANTAGTAQYVTANAQANITSVGTLTSLSVTGNVAGGNLLTGGVVSATGNVVGGNLLTGGSITATGNVTAANFFGNVFGNIVGNVDAAGSNTEIQFNTGNLLDASANLTFNKSTSTITVLGNATYATSGLEITANTITGNLNLGNLLITNQFQATTRGAVVIDTSDLIVGQDNGALGTNATVRGIRNQALELTTTNAGAPAVYVGKYVANSATYTGNVDVRSSNVGGYGGTGNINLTGNVYVGRNAQGSDTANAKANLIVTDSVYVNQNLSVAGNILFTNLSTAGNITAGNLITGGNVFGNVIAARVSGVGTANLDITQSGNSLGATTLNLAANIVVTGGSASSVITSAPGSNLQLTASQGGSSGQPRVFVDQYDPGVQAGNVDVRTGGGAITGGFAANATLNISGNVRIGPYAPGVAPASTGINLEVAGAISATGNVTGNYFFGNGSQLTGINAANIVGAYGNANVANFLGNGFGSNTITTTGNITTGNLLTGGVVTATGNVSAGNLRTAGLVTATGNVTGGNLITAGTVSATAATANVLLSNVVIVSRATNSGQQIYPATAPDLSGAATAINPGRMLFGNGFQGNVSNGVDAFNRQTRTRFGFWDTVQLPSGFNTPAENMVSTAQFQLTGNTGTQARLFSVVNFNNITSEGVANTFTSTGTVPAAAAGFNCFVNAGNWANSTTGGMANVGNVILNTAAGGVFGTVVFTGSTMGNSYGIVSTQQSTNGTINNQIYFSAWDSLSGTPSTPGNVFVYHNPGTTNSYGVTHSNIYRAATNYYFLRNDDAVAQVQLGSLRSYNEFQYSTATSGTVNIDKNNSQVQFLNPTGIVTIGDFQNFVTTANDGTNNDSQTDTMTLVIQQGAIPAVVTMPTGNAAIKYLGGISTVGSTANAVSIVTIKAIRSAANAALYLTSISSEYT